MIVERGRIIKGVSVRGSNSVVRLGWRAVSPWLRFMTLRFGVKWLAIRSAPHSAVGFDGPVMVEEGFTERHWHWWLSRVVIPIVVAAVALAGLLWVNRDRNDADSSSGTSPSAPACADRPDALATGWGPDRPTVGPTDYSTQPSFNIDRDNPNYGDERNFLTTKEASFTNAGGWTDVLDVVAGGEYYLRVNLHNGARDTLENVARDTKVRFDLPACAGKAVAVEAVISSPSAYPQAVWDTVVFRAPEALRVELVPGSGEQANNRYPQGIALPDRIAAASGALVGSATADGNVGGDYRNSLVVTARVRTVRP